MEHVIGYAHDRLHVDSAGDGFQQRHQFGGATAHPLMRLRGRVTGALPTAAGLRHGLKGARFVFTPHRQTDFLAQRIGPFDQLFFGTASLSSIFTTPCLRARTATPVAHHVRLFCQLRPARCKVLQRV